MGETSWIVSAHAVEAIGHVTAVAVRTRSSGERAHAQEHAP